MENPNTHVGLSGVALRQMLSRTIPKDALRRLSMKEYERDVDWIAALREATRREETFLEDLSFRQDHTVGSNGSGKRKREDKATTKPKRQKKEYTAEEKAAYKLKKENERKGTGQASAKGKIINTNWSTTHQGIQEAIIQTRKQAKQCTHCGLSNHKWEYCFRQKQVSAVGARGPVERKIFKPSRQWKAGPIAPFRKPQVAAIVQKNPVPEESRVNQIERPLAWDFSDMES